MNGVICTLFEGDYHFGVAALVNSLYYAGFRGRIFAGYRGQLPPWACSASGCEYGKWLGASVLQCASGIEVIFLPLETNAHLANFKPEIMLAIMESEPTEVDSIFYFDPDICLVRRWTFFEEWVGCGLAVCEDVNSPYHNDHPCRVGWRRYFKAYGHELSFRFPDYANSGLVGVARDQLNFLALWRDLQAAMFDEIGGDGTTKLVNGRPFRSKGFADCFGAPDQDALNAAFEATEMPVSLLGREAMGFKHGEACALHALGSGKPWQRAYLWEAVRGSVPRRVDKVFWGFMDGPLKPYGKLEILMKRLAIGLASFLGRFYRRPA